MAHFYDTLVNVSITGPLIRLDFGIAQPVKTEDGKDAVRLTNIEQVVMPIDGFVNSFGMQQQIIQQLIKTGALKPRDLPQSESADKKPNADLN